MTASPGHTEDRESVEKATDEDEDDYHSTSEGGGGKADALDLPVHPVPAMQSAFEESFFDSTEQKTMKSEASEVSVTAEVRRKRLLDAERYDEGWVARWSQGPDAKHHPLLKLMSQIIFGLHLLQQEQAKSTKEVLRILQTHVIDMDNFMERTSDDLDLAIADIKQRTRHLRQPMRHMEVFAAMLADENFRSQLQNGHKKIEHIIARTGAALSASVIDIQEGLRANRELGKYLDSVESVWPGGYRKSTVAYEEMRGNEQGWSDYLFELLTKGQHLSDALLQLSAILGEMSKIATAVEEGVDQPWRGSAFKTQPTVRSKYSRELPSPSTAERLALNKPLPKQPKKKKSTEASEKQSGPVAEKQEQSVSPPPQNTGARPNSKGRGSPGVPRGPRSARGNTAELVDFLQHVDPLRSNPPDEANGQVVQMGKTSRSRSYGTAIDPEQDMSTAPPITRSQTHHGARQTGKVDNAKDSPKQVEAPRPLTGSRKELRPSGLVRRISKRVKQSGEEESLKKENGHSPPLTESDKKPEDQPPPLLTKARLALFRKAST